MNRSRLNKNLFEEKGNLCEDCARNLNETCKLPEIEVTTSAPVKIGDELEESENEPKKPGCLKRVEEGNSSEDTFTKKEGEKNSESILVKSSDRADHYAVEDTMRSSTMDSADFTTSEEKLKKQTPGGSGGHGGNLEKTQVKANCSLNLGKYKIFKTEIIRKENRTKVFRNKTGKFGPKFAIYPISPKEMAKLYYQNVYSVIKENEYKLAVEKSFAEWKPRKIDISHIVHPKDYKKGLPPVKQRQLVEYLYNLQKEEKVYSWDILESEDPLIREYAYDGFTLEGSYATFSR